MTSFITRVLSKFIYHGLSGFKTATPAVTTANTSNELTDMLNSVLESLSLEDPDYFEPDRVLTPFSSHLKLNGGEISNRSDFIEAILVSLNSLGEEIMTIAPGSTIESSIAPIDPNNKNIVVGQLKWDIDTVTSLVYPMCMDLLKDGFIYRTDTGSFSITTRIKI